MRKHLLLTTALCVVPVASAQAVGLMVGSGDGALSVEVDEFGGFDEAIYDPIGAFEAENTTASSFIAIGSVDSGFERLGDIASEPTVTTSGDETSTTSVFSAQGLDFELRQSVSQDFVQGDVTGATLTQSFTITNNSGSEQSFSLRRFFDGDLSFSEQFPNDVAFGDNAGVLDPEGRRTLFTIDARTFPIFDRPGGGDIAVASDTGASPGGAAVFDAFVDETPDPDDFNLEETFVAVESEGGVIPETGSFEIGPGYFEFAVLEANALSDDINFYGFFGFDLDENDDLFTDFPDDVAVATQNDFTLADGEEAVYVTRTIFGNAALTEPGESETFPILPDESDDDGFTFFIPPEIIEPFETIFFDPEIAIGYVYTVTGNAFFSVTAPTFGVVPDPDGYTLEVGGLTPIEIESGETIVFGDLGLSDVKTFTLRGIDPSLGLDPEDPLAFVTGVAFVNRAQTDLTQTAITANPIPLPASGWMLISAAGGLVLLRRFGRLG